MKRNQSDEDEAEELWHELAGEDEAHDDVEKGGHEEFSEDEEKEMLMMVRRGLEAAVELGRISEEEAEEAWRDIAEEDEDENE